YSNAFMLTNFDYSSDDNTKENKKIYFDNQYLSKWFGGSLTNFNLVHLLENINTQKPIHLKKREMLKNRLKELDIKRIRYFDFLTQDNNNIFSNELYYKSKQKNRKYYRFKKGFEN